MNPQLLATLPPADVSGGVVLVLVDIKLFYYSQIHALSTCQLVLQPDLLSLFLFFLSSSLNFFFR